MTTLIVTAYGNLTTRRQTSQAGNEKINSKVLDFVQFGGPNETVLRTFFWEIAL